jgi:hypothetical protein
LRDRFEEFTARGAQVATIAAGFPAMAKDFQQEYRLPFPVLVDQKKASYRALGLRRGSLPQILGLRLARRAGALLKFGWGLPAKGQDVFQLGGALVVGRGGAVQLVHRSKDAGDSAPVDALLGALA